MSWYWGNSPVRPRRPPCTSRSLARAASSSASKQVENGGQSPGSRALSDRGCSGTIYELDQHGWRYPPCWPAGAIGRRKWKRIRPTSRHLHERICARNGPGQLGAPTSPNPIRERQGVLERRPRRLLPPGGGLVDQLITGHRTRCQRGVWQSTAARRAARTEHPYWLRSGRGESDPAGTVSCPDQVR